MVVLEENFNAENFLLHLIRMNETLCGHEYVNISAPLLAVVLTKLTFVRSVLSFICGERKYT